MSDMKNIIGLRRNKVFLSPSDRPAGEVMAMTVAAELMQFGYVTDPDALTMLKNASREDLEKFHNETLTYLKDITGANRNYRPFWKGFPEEVMEKSELELWFHQIIHYISNGHYEPNEWTKERPTAFENSSYTVLSAGTEDEFLNIFTDLVSVNQSLTPQDLREVRWFAENIEDLRLPKVIPFKETLTTLASLGVKVPVKTTVDVLRIATAMSGGDTSLPKVPPKEIKLNRWSSVKSPNPEREKFKFKNFTRKERRYLLELLESTHCKAEEAVLKEGRWIRLGEKLHPGEYADKYPKAFKMFSQLRNDRVRSWYSELEGAFRQSTEKGLQVLSQRPGELVRRLDWLVRTKDVPVVMDAFSVIAPKVSNKVLYETLGHFEKRTRPVHNRTIMVKGARKRTKLPDLPAISNTVVERIQDTIKHSLQEKFSKLEPLGSVWIDPELSKIPVPTNMRSVSDALRPTVRGQRVPIGNQDAKVIRAYVHWQDDHGREDIDLTATFLGMGKIEHIGWNGVRNSQTLGCYSGDVRHRRGSCAEYIDINVKEALKAGYKYVVMDANNFNGRGFNTLECAFGYMEREHPKANEIFKPSTLANAVKLQSTASTILVAVIDLETQEYIFLDIDKSGLPVTSTDFNGLMEAIKPYCEKPAFSVYDLLKMHTDVRGSLAENPGEADTKFEFAPFSESYVEVLKYMGV
jgi:hypothetical protein